MAEKAYLCHESSCLIVRDVLYTLVTPQVSALRSSEASAFGGFKCISIIVSSIGGSGTVHSRGGVLSSEGPLIEVLLYSVYYHAAVHR